MPNRNEHLSFTDLANLAITLHLEGKIDKAKTYYQYLLDHGYTDPRLLSNYGVICKQQGDISMAKKLYRKSIQNHPNSPEAFSNLGNILMEEKELNEAETYLKQAIKLKPDFADAHFNISSVLIEKGLITEAEFHIKRALEYKPHSCIYNCNLSSVFIAQGKLTDAESCINNALRVDENSTHALLNLSTINIKKGFLDKALINLKRLLELDPNCIKALYNLVCILRNQSRLDEAEQVIKRVIEIDRYFDDIYVSYATILIDKGQLENAIYYLRKAIRLNPDNTLSYYLMSTLRIDNLDPTWSKYLFTDKILKGKNNFQLIDIYFARANIKHLNKKYSESSKYYKLANTLKLSIFPSDCDDLIKESNQLYSISKDINRSLHLNKVRTEHIFIVGMPRSGSTLAESIISMNPRVGDIGEKDTLEKSYLKWSSTENHKYRKNLYKIYTEMTEEIIGRYDATTNKMLYNFQYIGIICNCMPNSKIIYCKRNPLDNILSIYRSHFANGNRYSSCLAEIAKLYLFHEDIISKYMKYTHDNFFVLNYDELVLNPDTVIQTLIAWLGWDWKSEYLSPHLNNRNVFTRSNVEARYPINNKSLYSWKNYKEMLKPAIDILDDLNLY